jgi:hypothetical protein
MVTTKGIPFLSKSLRKNKYSEYHLSDQNLVARRLIVANRLKDNNRAYIDNNSSPNPKIVSAEQLGGK